MDQRPVKREQAVSVMRGPDYRVSNSDKGSMTTNCDSWFGCKSDSPPRSSWFGYKDEESYLKHTNAVDRLRQDVVKKNFAQ
jgi:hypothetical protein